MFTNVPPKTRRAFPLTLSRLPRLARLIYPPDGGAARRFAEALFNSDLLAMSGCGLITDAFSFNAIRFLDVLAAAERGGIPTVMLGQGLGPIRDEKLFRRAGEVLPRVGAIFIRERHASLDLLKQLRVPEAKIFITGDDTVECAFHQNRPTPGNRIGVNLRVADYSALDGKILETVRATLAEKARQHQTTLAGIPILRFGTASDLQTLRQLIGDENTGDNLATPLEVIRRVSDCRVVVAGSYHAGVFALAQGIPVVGIIRSAYYRDKFQGLAGEFGAGCVVLRADDAEFSRQLSAAIDELWERAAELKPQLLSAAERQIKTAQSVYARLPGLLHR
jgi:colanic acid/amylovoran biosynthesis protein